jgi:hypothetical protein
MIRNDEVGDEPSLQFDGLDDVNPDLKVLG